MYRFSFWCGPEAGSVQRDVTLSDDRNSEPLYTWNRGYWFDNNAFMTFSNLSLGNSFSISAWYNTDAFMGAIFGSYTSRGEPVFAMYMSFVRN